MKPKKLRVPAPVHHKASGQDVVFLRDPDGTRRMVYLGQHGSTEAARRYREVLVQEPMSSVLVQALLDNPALEVSLRSRSPRASRAG